MVKYKKIKENVLIISASRRCDIPKYGKKWLLENLKQEYVNVTNPFNRNQIKKVSLKSEDVDLFVFWTKDCSDFTDVLDYLKSKNIKFLIQYTINGYPPEIEPHTGNTEKIINNFNDINLRYPGSVLWRYDPVILADSFDLKYHTEKFSYIFQNIKHSTARCYTSFFDEYRKNKKFITAYNVNINDFSKYEEILTEFDNIVDGSDVKLVVCSEPVNYISYKNVIKGACIDKDYINEVLALNIQGKRDSGQRKFCSCVKSIDIGAYNQCRTGCKYCYACNNN